MKKHRINSVLISLFLICAMADEIKEIYLNRPFVYMIIDCENNIPLFIGTVTDVAQ